MSKEIADEIFELQRQLNKYVWDKRDLGVSEEARGFYPWEENSWEERQRIWGDTLSPLEETWIKKYVIAAADEVTELLVAIGEPKFEQEAELEVIDIIHFAVSVAILCRWAPSADTFSTSEALDIKDIDDLAAVTTSLLFGCIKIHSAVNWKWWSDPTPTPTEKLHKMVPILFQTIMEIASFMGMKAEGILKLYRWKWQVNKDRQDKGYCRDTKTEDDNKAIANA